MTPTETAIAKQWDELNSAIKCLLVAQPAQISDAAEKLAGCRYGFEETIRKWLLEHAKMKP